MQDHPVRRPSNIEPEFEARVRQVVPDWGVEKSPELTEELILPAPNMARAQGGPGLGGGDEFVGLGRVGRQLSRSRDTVNRPDGQAWHRCGVNAVFAPPGGR